MFCSLAGNSDANRSRITLMIWKQFFITFSRFFTNFKALFSYSLFNAHSKKNYFAIQLLSWSLVRPASVEFES